MGTSETEAILAEVSADAEYVNVVRQHQMLPSMSRPANLYGAVVRSQPLGLAMGAPGASRSIYVHFIARGHDVVLPKNTGMEIEIGSRPAPASAKLPEDTIQ